MRVQYMTGDLNGQWFGKVEVEYDDGTGQFQEFGPFETEFEAEQRLKIERNEIEHMVKSLGGRKTSASYRD